MRSDSYSWGATAANSAVTIMNFGMEPEAACQTVIALSKSNPPPNVMGDEAQRGCLDAVHKQLGR